MRSASPTPQLFRNGVWTVEFCPGDSEWRLQRERELLENGVALPFASRALTESLSPSISTVFVSVFDADARAVGGFAVNVRPAPLLRWHCVLRIDQLGASLPVEAAEAAVDAIVRWVRNDWRILRLSVDVFSPDAAYRRALGAVLGRHGLHPAAHINGYSNTLTLDLSRSEDDIFMSLHHSARRKIRQVNRHQLEVRRIDDATLSDRMNSLLQETLERTGGQFQARNWADRMELSNTAPDLSRIVGLFRSDVAGPDALLAFAWGCHNGDHAYYSEAASTRDTGDLRVPLAYALMWDLMLWAKRAGARWFDLGGVTEGTHADADPLGGISDFKRYFTQNVVNIRDEWILDTHSWQATLAAAVHRRVRRH